MKANIAVNIAENTGNAFVQHKKNQVINLKNFWPFSSKYYEKSKSKISEIGKLKVVCND